LVDYKWKIRIKSVFVYQSIQAWFLFGGPLNMSDLDCHCTYQHVSLCSSEHCDKTVEPETV
jgi:hypothetical protein